jgi:hypothetical protein
LGRVKEAGEDCSKLQLGAPTRADALRRLINAKP